jgi:DNA-binding response OmpR family regulator
MSGIVLYEEDGLMRALLREWLTEAGYGVREAALIRGGPAELVIVSIFMPKHTGASRLREIQAAHPGTPLIAISGQFRAGLSDGGATAQTLGAHRVMAKPLSRCDLLKAVRGIIGSPKSIAPDPG